MSHGEYDRPRRSPRGGAALREAGAGAAWPRACAFGLAPERDASRQVQVNPAGARARAGRREPMRPMAPRRFFEGRYRNSGKNRLI
jgi:hypothetical protein